MLSLRTVRNLTTLSFATTALLALPGLASAQAGGGRAPQGDPLSGRIVNLNVDDVDLYTALKSMFNQLKINYTLDPALKQVRIAANFHNLPGPVALKSLLNASGQHFTYRLEDGVYNIMSPQPQVASERGTRVLGGAGGQFGGGGSNSGIGGKGAGGGFGGSNGGIGGKGGWHRGWFRRQFWWPGRQQLRWRLWWRGWW